MIKHVKLKKNFIIGVSLVAIASITIWLAYFVIPNSIFSWVTNIYMPSYAKDIAKPIDEALVKAGGVRVCEGGDNGRSPSNQMPWYEAYYEVNVGRENAIKIINQVASDNGYSLTHASKENRGELGFIADEFINNWYFDDTSKPSTYSELQSGQIKLAFGVNNDGQHSLSNISCGTKDAVKIDSGADKTMLSISVRLPEFKR